MKTLHLELASALVLTMISSAAMAHALLMTASPAVGGSVSASPEKLTLQFSEALEPRFSGISLKAADGTAVPTGALSVDAKDPTIVNVKIGRHLLPGDYTVEWRAVSVDTHRTEGHFSFTVK